MHEHEVIYRDGKPAAVILEIGEYKELLERIEDSDDLRALREMRKRPLKFRKLDEFLKDNPLGYEQAETVVRDAPAGASRVRRTPRSKR